MRSPRSDGAARTPDVEESGPDTAITSISAPLNQVPFLKLRYANAIERGDDAAAERLRRALDRVLNGPRP